MRLERRIIRKVLVQLAEGEEAPIRHMITKAVIDDGVSIDRLIDFAARSLGLPISVILSTLHDLYRSPTKAEEAVRDLLPYDITFH